MGVGRVLGPGLSASRAAGNENLTARHAMGRGAVDLPDRLAGMVPIRPTELAGRCGAVVGTAVSDWLYRDESRTRGWLTPLQLPSVGTVNSLVREHLPATYFKEYQSLRTMLSEILTDDDLGFRLGGTTATLGALCREIGDIEYSYIESLKTFRQDFSYRHPDSRVETSVDALKSWYLTLDADLDAAIAALSEDDIANRRIVRDDFDIDDFNPLPAVQLDVYREALLIFYGKVSIYLRSLHKPMPARWQQWIG